MENIVVASKQNGLRFKALIDKEKDFVDDNDCNLEDNFANLNGIKASSLMADDSIGISEIENNGNINEVNLIGKNNKSTIGGKQNLAR